MDTTTAPCATQEQAPAETPSESVMWNALFAALVASMQNEVAEMYL